MRASARLRRPGAAALSAVRVLAPEAIHAAWPHPLHDA